MRRRTVMLALVWLAGAVGLGWGLWPSRYRPWPLPNGWVYTPVPGTHHVDYLPTLDEGDSSGRPPAFGSAWERWDLDTGRQVSAGPELPAYRHDWRYGSSGLGAATVRPADESDDTPLRLVEWPSGRELGRHPAPAHLFAVGEPGDRLYAVGLPAEDTRNPRPVTPADLADPWQVHIHETGTGRLLRSLPGASLANVATSGRLLVTIEPRERVPVGAVQTASVWDVTDGRRVGMIRLGPSDQHRRHDLHLSGNGRYLFSSSGLVWAVESGAVVRPAHPDAVTMTALSKDGRWLFQVDHSGTMFWFDSATGTARIDRDELPVPGYGNAGGSACSAGPWGDGRMFVARASRRPPGRIQQWLSINLPRLYPPAADYDWHDFRILEPETGQTVLSAPVFVTHGTDDGEMLFVTGPDGQPRLYCTGRLVPWKAAAAVAIWTVALLLIRRTLRRRRAVASH